jgi:tetratricopeptide (TPR) repeat protein
MPKVLFGASFVTGRAFPAYHALFPVCCLLSTVYCLSGSSALGAQEPGDSELEGYSRQAEQAMAAKDWATATSALEKLAQLAPNVPEVQGNLGMAYYSQNRILEAAQAFEHALRLKPKMAQAELMLGLCDAELGRSREAVAILEPSFQHPADKNMGRLIGLDLQRAYADLGQHAKAVAVSDELLRRYPNDPEVLFHASRLYAERAYQIMRQLLQADPNSPWVHYAQAEIHESLQRHDLAIAEYRKVLETEPKLPGVHLRIGQALLQSSQDPKVVEEALSEFQRELAITPESADAEYEVGEIHRRRSQFDAALEHFSKAVRFQPDFAEAQIGLGRTLLSSGKPGAALAALNEGVRLDPQNEVPHFLLASAYKALGETAKYRQQMAFYEKDHAAGPRTGLHMTRTSGASQVTQQELDSEAHFKP